MKNIELSPIEKEMANFDFSTLNMHVQETKSLIAKAKSVSEVTSQICDVWSKIRKYVKLAENIPFIGKFIKILADLLDSICAL